MVALPVFLLVGTAYWASEAAGGVFEASISGTYLLPVRDIFVGAMVGTAVCLIAYRGAAVEDYVLNHAGFYALFVAFVPTGLGKLYTRDPQGWSDLVKSLKVTTASLVAVGLVFIAVELIAKQWTYPQIFAALREDGDSPLAVVKKRGLGWFILGATVAGLVWFAYLLYFRWTNADPGAPIAPDDAGLPVTSVFEDVHKWATWLLLASLGMAVLLHGFPKQVGMAPGPPWWQWLCRALFALMLLGIPASLDWFTRGSPGDFGLPETHVTIIVEWWEVGLFAVFWFVQTLLTWEQAGPFRPLVQEPSVDSDANSAGPRMTAGPGPELTAGPDPLSP
ncbi:hypothetical protein AGMMS50218_12750 [Actinomycetota bacterium]|nr:hypothetical protein AGMMS50218_12750 [Actinomycetota bacterium]